MSGRLAFVMCGPQLEVAFRAPGQRVASLVRLAGVSPRSTLVLAAADLLVEDAGLEPSAVDRVLVTRGPGSFTGIRAGIATAQGLAAASGRFVARMDADDIALPERLERQHGVVLAEGTLDLHDAPEAALPYPKTPRPETDLLSPKTP